jgi:hypothetical protein
MKVTDIRTIAKDMGIKNTSKMKKISWRHQCGQQDCRWRQDCLAE